MAAKILTPYAANAGDAPVMTGGRRSDRAALLELHVYGHIQLKFRLTCSFAQDSELWLDEKVEYNLLGRNYLAVS